MKPEARLKQVDDAEALLGALRKHALAGDRSLNGYTSADRLIGRSGKGGVHVGQVCSRIDLACFNAGLPMLTMNWVRKPNSKVNPASFSGWEGYEEEFRRFSKSHSWTAGDFIEVQRQLDALPNKGAKALWNGIAEVGEPFIRNRLHCMVTRVSLDAVETPSAAPEEGT